MFKLLKKYMKGYWKFAILAPLFIIIDTLGSMLQPYFISQIIDVGIAGNDEGYIKMAGIMMIITAIISIIGGFLAMYFSSKAAYGYGANLRKDLIAKIQEFSFSDINKFNTSSLVTRLTNDVAILVNLVQMMLRMLIRAPFMLLGGIVMTIAISPRIALIFIVITPIIALIMLIVIKTAFPLFRSVQQKIDKVNSVIRENLIGAKVVKSFVREEYENQRFEKANSDLMDTNIRSYKIMTLLMPLIMVIMNLAVAAVLIIGGSGTIEVGSISAAITYMTITLMSLVMMSMAIMNLSRSKAAADRIIEILDQEPSIRNNENALQKNIEKGKVEYNIKRFEFTDDEGEAILENIKFTIEPGQKVAIIGSTGTGKSTLINLMPRFYDVTDGYVKIDDIDVREYDLKVLRDSIGMVPQENRLFEGTIEENIKWGKDDATIEEIKEACRVAQIDEYIEKMPEQYKSHVEQRGSNFSGGQKQRLAIARALIKKPKILILDDSVSALDSRTEIELRKALNKDFKDTTIFFIVQKISSCKDADLVIVVDDGTIVGMGTHDELINNNEVYQEIYNSQKEVMEQE